jgi:signal transduction histidine kinase
MGERFGRRIPEIVGRYRETLLRLANRLGTTPELWVVSEKHAALMLEACARMLDFPPEDVADRAGDEDLLASTAIGGLWAGSQARLVDLLSAMEALERHAFDAVVELAAEVPAEDRAAVLARAAAAIGRIGSRHARNAAQNYDAYLLRQIEQANSAERAKLARELHDRLGNSLMLAFRHLELYRMTTGSHPHGEKHFAAIRASLREATGFARDLISGLRSEAPLTNLAEAIGDCVATLNLRGLPVDIAVHGDETWLPAHHRDEIFLVVREFLRNSFAHAMAASISVRIRISPVLAEIEAADDGRGFVLGETGRRVSGLSSMRERTEHLGGQFALFTKPGGGTRIVAWVPLPREAAATGVAAPLRPATLG